MMLLDPSGRWRRLSRHSIKIAIGSGIVRQGAGCTAPSRSWSFCQAIVWNFIFAVLAEELGADQVLVLLALYLLVIIRGLMIAAKAQIPLAASWSAAMLILFVYVFVNIGMVSGILPVVGVPLPLVSYGVRR